MKNVNDFVRELKAEKRSREEREFARNQQLVKHMEWIFDQLQFPVIRDEFDHPHCDHIKNPVDIGVRRGGMDVCRLERVAGKMRLEDWERGSETFTEPEAALLAIVKVLMRHKEEFPIEQLEERRQAQQYRPVGAEM